MYVLHHFDSGEFLTTADTQIALAWFNARADRGRISIVYGDKSVLHKVGGPKRLDRRGKTPMDKGCEAINEPVPATLAIDDIDFQLLRKDGTAGRKFRQLVKAARELGVDPSEVLPLNYGNRRPFQLTISSSDLTWLHKIGLGNASIAARFVVYLARKGKIA